MSKSSKLAGRSLLNAAKQVEKDRYVRAYAQGHISEEELAVHVIDLKNQTDNLRLLLTSVEAELSERHERTALTDTRLASLAQTTPGRDRGGYA
jgi:hypothetical protein